MIELQCFSSVDCHFSCNLTVFSLKGEDGLTPSGRFKRATANFLLRFIGAFGRGLHFSLGEHKFEEGGTF